MNRFEGDRIRVRWRASTARPAARSDHDNLRAALDRLSTKDGADELRLAGALASFWAVRGHVQEGQERLARALARSPTADPAARAKALAGASVLAWARGENERSRACAEEALVLYREPCDGPGIVRALANLGFAAAAAGDVPRALVLYEDCLDVARRGGRERDVAVALNCLADLALRSREPDRARLLSEEALGLARECSDLESVAVALMNLGYAALGQERRADARVLLHEAAVAYASLGDDEAVALALEGVAAGLDDRPESAARLLGAAAARREAAGGDPAPGTEEGLAAVEHVRARLGDTAFATAWAEGRALGLEAALASARPVSPTRTGA